MPQIRRPGVEVRQGNLTLLLTYVTPRDFAIPGFYDVDRLEAQGEGYQRILNDTRANHLARHLKEAFSSGYANLPTTIFLATDKPIGFDVDHNELTFDTEDVCPFSVVDGQHRITGLLRAAQDEPRLLDFKLPASIATALNGVHQMYHFYIVNTTQRPVEPALQQQITKRFTDMHGVEDLPYLPHWLQTLVAKGTDSLALNLIRKLNEDTESPLYGLIQMANDPVGGRGRIKQAALANLLKSHVFTGINPIFMSESDETKRQRVMMHYFKAVDQLYVPNGNRSNSRVYQNNGLYFFLVISKWVFTAMYAANMAFTQAAIAETIGNAMEEIDTDSRVIAEPAWWSLSTGGISLNRANATVYANDFFHALSRSQQPRSQPIEAC